jgi:hypothetical protein
MSVRPLPLKLDTTTFNPNYYFTQGEYLENYGTQRLQGTFQVSKSVTYGNETVYGDSSFKDEPTIMSITDPVLLTSNHLVSKSYVDSVLIINPYPQIFTFGQSYSGTPLVTQPRSIKIRYLDNTPRQQSLYIQVIYDVQKANANQITRNSAIQRKSLYNVYYYKNDNNVFSHAYVELIDGDDIHRSFGGGSYQPIRFGTSAGNCIIRYEFPPINDTPNNPSSDGWLSSYSISFRILSSVPTDITTSATLSYSNSGGAYFE